MLLISGRWLAVVCFALMYSCKTEEGGKAYGTQIAAVTPGSCSVRARIEGIERISGSDSSDVCSKYPCRARVKVLENYGCGAGVSVPVNAGEVIEMKFAYTLHSTEVIPGLKAHFPGLKKGDVFTASISQRLVPGGQGEFVVYDYDKQ